MFEPNKNLTELQQHLTTLSDESYVVVCYCAQWCRTCQGFEVPFAALAEQFPMHVFVWVDVEEHEDLVVVEDLEDFPTILVQTKNGTVFFGPIPPFAEHIERLLQQAPSMPTTEHLALFKDLVISAT